MALRDAILETLSCMLSETAELRKVAEERNKALEVTEDYPVDLLEILLTQEEALEERQLAGILLRDYIKAHWASNGKYVNVPAHIKTKIKSVLPMGLAHPVPKVRSVVASAIAWVASYEFPHTWPEFDTVLACTLKSSNIAEVTGGIMLLDECVRMIKPQQSGMLAPNFYNELYLLLQNENSDQAAMLAPAFYNDLYLYLRNNNHDVKFRVMIINVVTSFMLTEAELHPTAPTLAQTVQNFVMLYGNQLTKPYNTHGDFCLNAQMFKSFQALVKKMPTISLQPIMRLLPTIFNLLQQCCNDYVKIIMNYHIFNDGTNLENEEENSMVTYEKLVDSIYSFIETLIKGGEVQIHLQRILPELVYSVILFMTITKRVEETWSEDEMVLYNDDAQDLVCTNIRATMKGLLPIICRNFEAEQVEKSFMQAIEKHINTAHSMKAENELYFSRVRESVMFTIGNISAFLLGTGSAPVLKNHLVMWTAEMNMCNDELVIGRTLWVGGKLSKLMDANTMNKHLGVIINQLRSNSHIARILAIRALSFHCSQLQDNKNITIFAANINIIFDSLIHLSQLSSGLNKILVVLSLDCMNKLTKISGSALSNHGAEIVPFVQTMFIRNMSNEDVIQKIQELLGGLSRSSEVVETFLCSFMPVIVNILEETNTGRFDNDTKTVAMELLNTVVTCSPLPLNEQLIQQGFYNILQFMQRYEDTGLLQSTAICLRSYLVKAPYKICSSHHRDRRGIDIVLNILQFFLNPAKQELSSRIIGRLVIAGMTALGDNLNPHFDILIKDVLTKMHTNFMRGIDDDLVIVFIYCFYHYFENTFNLLNVIPGPDGGSALQFVFVRWLRQQELFSDPHDININIMALTKVLETSVTTHDGLSHITVPKSNDCPNDGNKTDMVPLTVRLFTALLSILTKELYINRVSLVNPNDTTITSFHYNDSQRGQAPVVTFNSQTQQDSDDEEEEIEDTPTYDPIESEEEQNLLNNIDFMMTFLRNFSTCSHYYTIVDHLTPSQQQQLLKLGLFLNPMD